MTRLLLPVATYLVSTVFVLVVSGPVNDGQMHYVTQDPDCDKSAGNPFDILPQIPNGFVAEYNHPRNKAMDLFGPVETKIANEVKDSYDIGLNSAVCWTRIVTTLENQAGHVISQMTEYAISFETPADIPDKYVAHVDSGSHDTKYVKTSVEVPFETVHKSGDKTIREKKYVTCSSGPLYSRTVVQYVNNKKRLEIRVSPKKQSLKISPNLDAAASVAYVTTAAPSEVQNSFDLLSSAVSPNDVSDSISKIAELVHSQTNPNEESLSQEVEDACEEMENDVESLLSSAEKNFDKAKQEEALWNVLEDILGYRPGTVGSAKTPQDSFGNAPAHTTPSYHDVTKYPAGGKHFLMQGKSPSYSGTPSSLHKGGPGKMLSQPSYVSTPIPERYPGYIDSSSVYPGSPEDSFKMPDVDALTDDIIQDLINKGKLPSNWQQLARPGYSPVAAPKIPNVHDFKDLIDEQKLLAQESNDFDKEDSFNSQTEKMYDTTPKYPVYGDDMLQNLLDRGNRPGYSPYGFGKYPGHLDSASGYPGKSKYSNYPHGESESPIDIDAVKDEIINDLIKQGKLPRNWQDYIRPEHVTGSPYGKHPAASGTRIPSLRDKDVIPKDLIDQGKLSEQPGYGHGPHDSSRPDIYGYGPYDSSRPDKTSGKLFSPQSKYPSLNDVKDEILSELSGEGKYPGKGGLGFGKPDLVYPDKISGKPYSSGFSYPSPYSLKDEINDLIESGKLQHHAPGKKDSLHPDDIHGIGSSHGPNYPGKHFGHPDDIHGINSLLGPNYPGKHGSHPDDIHGISSLLGPNYPGKHGGHPDDIHGISSLLGPNYPGKHGSHPDDIHGISSLLGPNYPGKHGGHPDDIHGLSSLLGPNYPGKHGGHPDDIHGISSLLSPNYPGKHGGHPDDIHGLSSLLGPNYPGKHGGHPDDIHGLSSLLGPNYPGKHGGHPDDIHGLSSLLGPNYPGKHGGHPNDMQGINSLHGPNYPGKHYGHPSSYDKYSTPRPASHYPLSNYPGGVIPSYGKVKSPVQEIMDGISKLTSPGVFDGFTTPSMLKDMMQPTDEITQMPYLPKHFSPGLIGDIKANKIRDLLNDVIRAQSPLSEEAIKDILEKFAAENPDAFANIVATEDLVGLSPSLKKFITDLGNKHGHIVKFKDDDGNIHCYNQKEHSIKKVECPHNVADLPYLSLTNGKSIPVKFIDGKGKLQCLDLWEDRTTPRVCPDDVSNLPDVSPIYNGPVLAKHIDSQNQVNCFNVDTNSLTPVFCPADTSDLPLLIPATTEVPYVAKLVDDNNNVYCYEVHKDFLSQLRCPADTSHLPHLALSDGKSYIAKAQDDENGVHCFLVHKDVMNPTQCPADVSNLPTIPLADGNWYMAKDVDDKGKIVCFKVYQSFMDSAHCPADVSDLPLAPKSSGLPWIGKYEDPQTGLHCVKVRGSMQEPVICPADTSALPFIREPGSLGSGGHGPTSYGPMSGLGQIEPIVFNGDELKKLISVLCRKKLKEHMKPKN